MVTKRVLTLIVCGWLVVVPRSVMADCTSQFWDCARSAYKIPSFWGWYAAQIDCELDYIECERIALIGR